MSCQRVAETVGGPNLNKAESDIFAKNPVHITWPGPRNEDIEAYKAQVNVYTMNSRQDTGAYLTDSYGLSVKRINDKIYTRIDMQADADGRFRSAVSDGAELVIFDRYTENIDLRVPIASDIPPELDFFSHETALGRINLSLIRSEAQRLSFDVNEDAVSQSLALALPSRLFTNPYEERISTRAVFDTERELLNQVETLTVLNDGTSRLSTTYPVYTEYNNTYIKTGQVTTIENQVPGRVSGFDGSVKVYNSPEEVPEISARELEELKQQDRVQPVGKMIFGDPADLSHTITIVETYLDVEVNTVQNSAFRMIGGL
ncbi:MAG: hypothetical protein LBK27_06270 [Treponema sp.]|nr:hypothetical protein [Treponema sp.]